MAGYTAMQEEHKYLESDTLLLSHLLKWFLTVEKQPFSSFAIVSLHISFFFQTQNWVEVIAIPVR